jgi:hypothetical protein
MARRAAKLPAPAFATSLADAVAPRTWKLGAYVDQPPAAYGACRQGVGTFILLTFSGGFAFGWDVGLPTHWLRLSSFPRRHLFPTK